MCALEHKAPHPWSAGSSLKNTVSFYKLASAIDLAPNSEEKLAAFGLVFITLCISYIFTLFMLQCPWLLVGIYGAFNA